MNNKKTLVYTTCDFSSNSYKCTELLYRSLLVNNSDFDFYIISNTKSSESEFPIIVEDSPNRKILANWKYTKLLPEGYNQYFYLDSDILCFGKLEDLCDDNDLSLCTENHRMSDSEYFCYKDATPEEKLKMKDYNGFQAGSFGFKNMKFLSEIRELIEPKLNNPIIPDGISREEFHRIILPDAMLDQTSLNYYVLKQLPDMKYFDFTDKVLIRPDDPVRFYTENKMIYHFCGFRAEMNSKYQRMVNWCRYNNIEI
jgi:hypothetical protein